MDALTPQQQQRLLELVANPPAGSEIEAAKKAGVDLILMVRLLGLTPQQRVDEMERYLQFQHRMEQALRKTQRGFIPDYEFS
jgi:hypothetical protein